MTDAIGRCENIGSCSYGDPVLERRRPGGSDLAKIGQGSQAHLSLPSGCRGVSYYGTAARPTSGWGFREDERNDAEIGDSRGKRYFTRTIERRLRQRNTPTDVGAWGRMEGAQGALIQPEWIRGCEHT